MNQNMNSNFKMAQKMQRLQQSTTIKHKVCNECIAYEYRCMKDIYDAGHHLAKMINTLLHETKNNQIN